MSDKQVHTLGAGGLVSNITSTNGQRFILPVKSSDDVIISNLVRRILIEFDNDDTSVDKQFAFNDVAFLIKSLVNYLYSDAEFMQSLGMTAYFSSTEEHPQKDIARDLRAAAEKLSTAANLIEAMPTALVDKTYEDQNGADV